MSQPVRTLVRCIVGGWIGLVTVAAGAAPADFSANAGATVGRVRSGEHPGFSRVVLDTTKKINVRYESSPDSKTIAVELPNIIWAAKKSLIYKYSKNISRIEYVPNQGGGGTMLIEGKEAIGLRWAHALGPHRQRGHRFVFDVAPKSAATLPGAALVVNNQVIDATSGRTVAAHPTRPAMPAVTASDAPPMAEAPAGPPDDMKAQKEMAQGGAEPESMAANRGARAYVAARGGLAITDPGGFDLEDGAAPHTTDTDAVMLGGTLGGAFGIDWGPTGLPIRSELEITHRFDNESDIEATNTSNGVSQNGTMTVSSQNYMINTYYDIPTGGSFVPYIGFGIGLSRNSVEVDTTLNGAPQAFGEDAMTSFSWSLNTGAAYYLNPAWALELGYRYIEIGEIRTRQGSGANAGRRFEHGSLKSHDLSLGLRYRF